MMKMNKAGFINELSKQLSLSVEKYAVINDILEGNFFISKKSKPKIVDELIRRLDISSDSAENIYDVSVRVLNSEIKNKLHHPFGRKD